MLRKFISQNAFLYALLVVVGFTVSCKKSKNDPDGNGVPQGTSGTREELTKDSIYLYAQQTYYWNVGMPSYSSFNPRQYNSNNAVLAALKALPSTGGKDKYSFIDDGTVAGELGGVGGEVCFFVFFWVTKDL
jgi:carboxyl-terminal processing protease